MFLQCSNKIRNCQAVKGSTRSYSTAAVDAAHSATLPSGVKVVTLESPGPVGTLSLYVKAGSRYETQSTLGSTHFLKHLAFKSSHLKSANRLIRDLENMGATFHTEISRESIGYHFQNFSSQTRDHEILGHTLLSILEPNLHEYEIDRVRKIIESETCALAHDPQNTLLEVAHAYAFPDNGLGNSLYVSPSVLDEVDTFSIAKHVKTNFFPGDRITIVSTGFNNDALQNIITPHFADGVPEFQSEEGSPVQDKSVFVGNQTVRINAPPVQTHVTVAYSGRPRSHKELSSLFVLKELIENNCQLSKHQWILDSNVFNLSYSDAGLFGFYVYAQPGHGSELIKVIQNEFQLENKLTNDTINAAKASAMVKRMIHVNSDRFNLANHAYNCVVNGVGKSGINEVTLEDVRSVLQSLTSQKPVIVAAGDVRGIK